MQLLQRTLGEHVELLTDLDPGLDLVLADPGHIEQILVNLAVNARDAMPGGGTLTIATGNLDVDESYADSHTNLSLGRYVALKISDTGTGMPPEVIDRAFEPFFTTKPKAEGSALGLATIYGIVAQAGGNVRIYSEPQLGTAITVLLPVTDQSPPAAERAPDQSAGGGNELVVVVEDEPARREGTRPGPARRRARPGPVGRRRQRASARRRRRARAQGGDPAHPRPQRLPGDRGRQRPGGHRRRGQRPGPPRRARH